MEEFKIEYKINDYTPAITTGFNVDFENVAIYSVTGGFKYLMVKDYVFNIHIGNYCCKINQLYIDFTERDLDDVLDSLLISKHHHVLKEGVYDGKLTNVVKGDQMVAYMFNDGQALITYPNLVFLYRNNQDEVKVYLKYIYQGELVNIKPPWEIVEGPFQPIAPIICSKKQIVRELYQLYTKMVQDIRKMYPEFFTPEGDAYENYQKWKEKMKRYKEAIQAM